MPYAKPIFQRVALAGLALCLSLLVAETAARVLRLGPSVYDLSTRWFQFSHLPGVDYEFRPGVAYGTGFINDDSMRDLPRNVEKPDGVYRIACIGDSICAGLGVAAGETFSRVWERSLRDRGVAAEVLNFGVPGYALRHILAALHARTLKYDPDMVVYAFCLNDAQEESYELEALKHLLSPAQRDFYQRTRGAAGTLLSRSRLYNLVRYGIASLRQPAEPAPAPKPEDDPQFAAIRAGAGAGYFRGLYQSEARRALLAEGFLEFAALADEHGFTAVVAIFPVSGRVGSGLEAVYEFIAETATDAGLHLVDLRAAFKAAGGDRLFADPLHPNARGHRVAAEALDRELSRMLP